MVTGWVKIPRRFAGDLPNDRPFTRLEAAYSFALDQYEGQEWTLRGYARLWQWSTGKVSRFLDEIGVDMGPDKVINCNRNSETGTEQERDDHETPKDQENSMLEVGAKQGRNRSETETKRTIIEKKRSNTFDQFWYAYPRKTGKALALKIWQRLNPSPDTITTILTALEWQCLQPDWQKDSGRFIPHPSTWLNGRRWEDERPASQAPARSAAMQSSTLEDLRAKGIDV